jgi:DNA-binding winged helix-turn-helix (wHTH) protein
MVRISDRLEICFDTNEIISMNDNNTSTKTKVEPRIMQVLQILVNNSPKVVSRDQLISEVWDNYGGADDALNQSISHLRKLLNDTNKEKRIIETVVKKGYRFTSEIETETNRQGRTLRFWIVLITIILISFALLFYLMYPKESFAPEAPQDIYPVTDSIPAPDVE